MKRIFALTILLLTIPGFVLANSTASTVGTGINNVGIVTDKGQLMMWGKNEFGEFGTGEKNSGNEYCKFTESINDAAAVTFGCYNSTAVIKTDGSLWTCGANNCGQLGNGTKQSSAELIKIDENVVKVCGGEDFFVYLKKDGSVWMTGNTSYFKFFKNFSEYGQQTTPIKILDGIKDISASARNVGVITLNNELYMFGGNVLGQLGTGNTEVNYEVQPVKTLDNVRSVSCGTDYVLAVKNDNTLWSWGTNDYGQLMNGQSSSECVSTPAMVAEDVLKACAGTDNSAYITTKNTLYMSGNNLYGEMGSGVKNGSSETVQKISLNVRDVALGKRTVYVTTDGKVYTAGHYINEIGKASEGFKMQRFRAAEESKYTIEAPVYIKKTITLKIGSDILNCNGIETKLDVPAQTIDGRTVVPMRAIFEALGASVSWDGETQTAAAVKDNTTVNVQIESDSIVKNGEKIPVDVPAQIKDGRTLVPVRAVSEAFECSVEWNEDTSTVTITQ